MARPLRIEYPGAWYHVMNRGGGRGFVFPSDALRRAFLRLLGEAHHSMSCVLPDGQPLTPAAAHTRCQAGASDAARRWVYTQRHNRLRGTGSLFRGRYKAQLIEDGDYLWLVSRYIHRNPVEAGLCTSPVDYSW